MHLSHIQLITIRQQIFKDIKVVGEETFFSYSFCLWLIAVMYGNDCTRIRGTEEEIMKKD